MDGRHVIPLADGRVATVVFTDADDGDFRVVEPTPGLDQRRGRLHPGEWSWLIQVHGREVHHVERPGHHAGREGDGLTTVASDCPIAVTTADCAPVVLVAERGVAVVHAGWRGLAAGVIERAADDLSQAAGSPVAAMLGPCISPGRYQFGAADLARLVDRYGPALAAVTDDGDPALDVPAGVGRACRDAGWPAPERPPCTSDPRWFSHRTRGDRSRQVAVAWIEGRTTT